MSRAETSPTDPASGAVLGSGAPAGFRHLGDDPVAKGWRIELVRSRFEAPDGTAFARDVVRHPGAVAVVVLEAPETVLLLRQYRGAFDQELLEIPAGTRDEAGEAPEQTALREVAEELGVRPRRLEPLGDVCNSPGYSDQRTRLYLATDLEACDRQPGGIEEQHMSLVKVSLGEALAMVDDGRICDAQSVLGLLLTARRLHGAVGTSP